jgi:hypothetical protein
MHHLPEKHAPLVRHRGKIFSRIEAGFATGRRSDLALVMTIVGHAQNAAKSSEGDDWCSPQ